MARHSSTESNRSRNTAAPRERPAAQGMQAQLLKDFAPAAVLINKDREIVNLYGPTEKYLHMSQCGPAMDLTALIRHGLRTKMRTAVQKAIKKHEAVAVSGARIKRDDGSYPVRFTIRPVEEKGISESLFLVTFEEETWPSPASAGPADPTDGEETLVRRLQNELEVTRKDLQNTIRELEIANEEQKASTEEMMSMNEELKASTEEMMSMNEELNTVNADLREKIEELENSNNDLINLMDSTEVAVIFLSMNSMVRRFTPSAKKLFNLIPSDVGRPIGDLAQRFSDDELVDHVRQVTETHATITKVVNTHAGQWFIRRILPFRTQDNRVEGLVLTFSDVTDMKSIEAQLRTSERKFRHLAENMPGMVLKYKRNPDGSDNLLYISKGVRDLFEVSPEDAVENNKLLWDRIHRDDLEGYVASIKASAEHLSFWEREHRIQLPDGRVKWIHNRGVPVQQEDGSIVWDTLAVDITDRKRALEQLQRSQLMLARTESIAHIGSWEWEIAADTVTWSRELYRIFHIDPREKPPNWAQHDCLYHPEDMRRLRRTVETSIASAEPYELELRALRRDGETRICLVKSYPETDAEGNVRKLVGFLQDINERKQAEAALQNALAEKEILLREIHHRVKNNMQTIVGLLRMHARRTDDGQLTQIFNDCRDRVTAMSLIHESLYQSDDLARIDFEDYLKKLCRNLGQAHDAGGKGITLTSDLDHVSLNMDQGIAVGLVVSELIANAFKHAFPGEGSGRVAITVKRIGGEVELTVADDGAGLPADFDIRKTPSLGLKLVEATVTRELGGAIDVESHNGARFTIRFKCKNQTG